MNRVVQMVKRLHEPVALAPVEGFRLRTFDDQRDLVPWLALRQATFAREKLGVREWNVTDFCHEFSTKPWWNPQHCWLVEPAQQSHNLLPVASSGAAGASPTTMLLGSVTLAMRSGGDTVKPVVHWLMVHPRARSRGLARWLLSTLETQAWQLGHREIYLETHSAWAAAARFYLAAGYGAVNAEDASH